MSQQLWEAKAENSHRYRNKETTCITWCCSEGTPAPHRQRAGDWCQGHQCWVLLTAHLNNGPGSLPASTCHLWERFSSSIQVSSNQRGPETCVKPKPPKYPAKSQQNPLNPMARTSRKPQCTKSHSGAATANYWSWPWHQWDSFRHRARSKTGGQDTWCSHISRAQHPTSPMGTSPVWLLQDICRGSPVPASTGAAPTINPQTGLARLGRALITLGSLGPSSRIN